MPVRPAGRKSPTLRCYAAEPDELSGIEHALRCGRANERLHCHAAPDNADLTAVPRCGVIDVVREIERTGAGTVLRKDCGIAREIFAEMTRKQPAIGVVAVTRGRKPDQQLDL